MFKTDGHDVERFLKQMRTDRELEDKSIEKDAVVKIEKKDASAYFVDHYPISLICNASDILRSSSGYYCMVSDFGRAEASQGVRMWYTEFM
ncbi:MAG: hypothetical protein LBT14_13825 [Treponema sp.]|jgi:hypothetical protein|nr:hypothetical protein [Treponema sp.]